MGLLRRLVDALDPPTEERSISSRDPVLARALGGLDSGGYLVNANSAQNLSVVLACVNSIASSLSTLPCYVYRDVGNGGREIDDVHPLARLIRNGANRYQSWGDFIEWLVASTLLRGNGVAEIVTDGAGRITELRAIPFEWCGIQILESGRLLYRVSEINSIYGGQGGSRNLLQDEVLHVKDRSDDALLGRSRLQRAAAVISAGLTIQDFGASMYHNGVRPSGSVEVDGKLTDVGFKRLQDQLADLYSGTRNVAKTLILENGLKWKQISISPEDAEFLASRKFTVEELARIFSVPPPVIGDLSHSTFTNSQTMLQWFATATLTPWAKKIESEFARSVFSSASRATRTIEFDLSGLLRGTPTERWQCWDVAIKNNILTADEIRSVEGWNPRGQAGAA